MSWLNADYGNYEEINNDEVKIINGIAVPCRICESAFRRLRMTLRYCATCHRGFGEGEHLSFAGAGRGRCLFCGPRP